MKFNEQHQNQIVKNVFQLNLDDQKYNCFICSIKIQ